MRNCSSLFKNTLSVKFAKSHVKSLALGSLQVVLKIPPGEGEGMKNVGVLNVGVCGVGL
jgi:hypothetical protein